MKKSDVLRVVTHFDDTDYPIYFQSAVGLYNVFSLRDRNAR